MLSYPSVPRRQKASAFSSFSYAGLFFLWMLFPPMVGCNGPVTPDGGNPDTTDCGGACKDGEECVSGQFCLAKCKATESRCGSKCIDTKTDKAHCGKCDQACKDTESCKDGACKAASTCATDETDCSGVCVKTKTDAKNCGGCGKACLPDESCQDGACKKTSACGSEETECNGTCVNTKTNKAHCGACGQACGTDLICQNGACKCQGSLTDCNGTCVDTQSSDPHCGKCDNPCTSPQYCDVGACVCPTGQTVCGPSCVNPKTDVENCGACGTKCPVGQSCVDGACKSKCTAPEEECSGACVNPQTDVKHCGSCGNACQTGEICQSGTCSKPCQAHETNCSGACVDTQVDLNHCGGCAKACTSGQVCEKGACKLGCLTGQTECSGACVSLQTDKAHCGACGIACATAEFCSLGACKGSCATGETECSGLCSNLQQDPKNCGACATACASGEVCSAGVCIGSCASGETNCAGACVNLQTAQANCGTCGTICAGGKTCVTGTCSCPSGQSDCSGTCLDTQTDDKNCGTCGTLCTGGQICKAGKCEAPCPSGETLCAGVCVNLVSNKDHCGSCGNVCATGQVCTNSTCGITCTNGETACSGACVDLKSNKAHCGACGTACRTDQLCQASACVCPTGMTACSNACVDLQASRNNCGACGTPCTGTQVCVTGVCRNAWTAVLAKTANTRLDSLAANTKNNVYVTGTSANADASPNLFLQKIDAAGLPTDLSISSFVPHSFQADLNANQTVTATSWTTVVGWRVGGLPGLHNRNNHFNAATGEFTAPSAGYYLFNARLRFDDANATSNTIEAAFVIDGQVQPNNGTLVRLQTPLRSEGLVTEGLLKLNVGQKVTVRVRSNPDNAYTIHSESGLSAVFLGNNLKHGFHADLNGAKTRTSTSWGIVADWRTSGDMGLFANGGGFNGTTGEYTAPEDGLYYFSARPMFVDATRRPSFPTTLPGADTEAYISLNGATVEFNGRHSRIDKNFSNSLSFSPSGLIQLKKGDKISLRVRSEDNDHRIGDETGFSGYFVGHSSTGFSATINGVQNVRAIGWTQIKGFRTSGVNGLFSLDNRFDGTTGEYTIPTDGIYQFHASVMVNNAIAGTNQYSRVVFAVDGNRDLHRGTHINTDGPLRTRHTLHLNSVLSLAAGQKVSLWFYSHADDSYEIISETGFSGHFLQSYSERLQGYAVATDSNDNLFVAGAFQGNLDLLVPRTSPEQRTFLAKRKTDGSWEWFQTYAFSAPSSLQVDGTGSLFLCGNYTGAWTYATGKTLTATGTDAYVAKLNASGVPQWAVDLKSPDSTTQNPKCAVASTGEIYVFGTFTGKLTLGSVTLNNAGATGTFRYLARIKADGSGVEWAKQFGTTVALTGLTTDGSGNVYITGTFDKTATLDTTTLTSTTKEVFVLAFDKTGKILWSQQTKVLSNNVRSGGIAFFNGVLYITLDSNGRIEFGSTTASTTGSYDMFLATLHTTGAWTGSRSVSGANEDYNTSLLFDTAGNFYMTGAFKSPNLTYGLLVANKKTTDAAIQDGVVSKNVP